MKYLVDENGEILETIDNPERYIKLSEGDKVVRKGVLQYLSETTDLKYHFVKINPLIFDKYCKKYSILPTLISKIGYMDNICEFSNGKRIELKNLPKLCDVSESTIKRQINGMIKDDLIHKVTKNKKKAIMMNPYLCMRGKKIYLEVYEEFKLSHLRCDCEEWDK